MFATNSDINIYYQEFIHLSISQIQHMDYLYFSNEIVVRSK